MSFLRRLFGSPAADDIGGSDGAGAPADDRRPAVTAWIRLSDPDLGNEREEQRVFELENRIIKVIESAGAGIFDTNELARGAFGMRLLGDDPDRILELLRPLLADAPAGSYLTIRHGTGTSEERVEIQEKEAP